MCMYMWCPILDIKLKKNNKNFVLDRIQIEPIRKKINKKVTLSTEKEGKPYLCPPEGSVVTP